MLITPMERTPEERREIARKGGLAKAQKARERRALHACKYDDVARLRNDVASLARLVVRLADYLPGADSYELEQISARAKSLLKSLEDMERQDVKRIMYEEKEDGEA